MGISFTICEFLPKTVKDRNGRDMELLGVLLGENPFSPENFSKPLDDPAFRITFLIGNLVRDEKDCEVVDNKVK